jgi:hypothetical protein
VTHFMKTNVRLPKGLPLLVLGSLLFRGQSSKEEEPMSDREFYSGMSLVGSAVLVFWLIVHVLAA